MSGAEWSEWQAISPAWAPSPAVLAETLDGGQAFRWHREAMPSALRSLGEAGPRGENIVGGMPSPRSIWTGVWSDHIAHLRFSGDRLEWRAPSTLQPRVAAALPIYLGLDRDWPALADSLPWRSDAHLARCLAAYPGLRILRQPFGETLLGFLCSATKQIVQIKQMLGLLAERHGTPLPFPPCPLHRLPTWTELAAISEAELRLCQLGFRARFIHDTAQFLATRPGWLDETEQLPYAAAKARLLELPGVGEKIADCVLLFGACKLEAFPVDTWVLKSLACRYGLDGWKPAQVAQFGRAHFGPLAGLAQQFLFAWERSQPR